MSTTASPPTLQDLKPGDLVGIRIRVGFGGTRLKRDLIERVTATQIIVAGLKRDLIERVTATQIIVAGARYRRENGRLVGGEPYTGGIFPWTSEHDAELKLADAIERFLAAVK